ncbi:MAG: hypothetical protein ACRYG8_00135 [Janthinobacterium lividum]
MKRVIVSGWYGGGECDIEVSTDTAVCRHGGMLRRHPWRRASEYLARFLVNCYLRSR